MRATPADGRRRPHDLATVLVASPGLASDGTAKAQRRLNALGCNAGPVDGRTGTWTRTAVVRFQAANRLPQSGSLTRPPGPGCTPRRRCAAPPGRCRATGTGRRIVISQTQN